MARAQDSLVGKFFIEHDEKHQRYRTGYIKAAVADHHACLLCYDSVAEGSLEPMELVMLEELTETTECCGQKRWFLFNNRRELSAFIDWVIEPVEPEKPQTAKVLKLPKRSE